MLVSARRISTRLLPFMTNKCGNLGFHRPQLFIYEMNRLLLKLLHLILKRIFGGPETEFQNHYYFYSNKEIIFTNPNPKYFYFN